MNRSCLAIIFMLVASYTFLDYWAYSADYHAHPDTYDIFLRGQGDAPAQYRIGIIFAAKALRNAGHLAYRYSFTAFDFLFALGAGYLLRGVLAFTPAFREASFSSRWFRLATLLGLMSYYLGWSLWYQRTETMASAFFVVASLSLLSVVRSQALLVSGLVVLAVWQGFVRADVAILFHFGLFVLVLLRGARGFLLTRALLLGTSLVCCVLPTAILFLLMHKVYPHATYGNTRVFQLFSNFSPIQLLPFFLFLIPALYTFRRALARFSTLEGPQAAIILSSILYLGIWFLLGRAREVRIFVPYAMALIPLTANLVADDAERSDV